MLEPVYFDGQRLPAKRMPIFTSQIKIVLVPTFNDPNRTASPLATLSRRCSPTREIVPINCRDLVLGPRHNSLRVFSRFLTA